MHTHLVTELPRCYTMTQYTRLLNSPRQRPVLFNRNPGITCYRFDIASWR
jgi:hypothetical protein